MQNTNDESIIRLNNLLYKSLYNSAHAQIIKKVLPVLEAFENDSQDEIQVSFSSAHTSYFPLWCTVLQHILSKKLFDIDSDISSTTSYITQPLIIVTPNDEQARILFQTICAFSTLSYDKNSQAVKKNIFLPAWGAALGTPIAQYAPIRAARASSLYALAFDVPNILVCSIEQWNQLLPPRKAFTQNLLSLTTNQPHDPISISETLIRWNYIRVPRVSNEGEFALRGEVLDIYISKNTNAMNINFPVRVVFDFGTIESIKLFDLCTQLTTTHLSYVNIHPRSEYIWNSERIATLKKNCHNLFPEISTTALNKTIEQIELNGHDEWDYLYAMFSYDDPEHITQYFDNTPLVLFSNYEILHKLEDSYWNRQKNLFLSMGNIHCVPRYSRLFNMINESCKSIVTIPVYRTSNIKSTVAIGDIENNKFAGNLSYFVKYIHSNIDETMNEEKKYSVFLCTDDINHLKRITLLIKGASAQNPLSLSVEDSFIETSALHFVITDIASGFSLPEEKIALYSEVDLLGKKLHHFDSDSSNPIDTLQQIELGDLIVHIQYGIGKFIKLSRLTIKGVEKDFIQLVYANEEKLYIPIEQMNMIQRYIGQAKDKVSLDTIGGKAWEKKKRKALEKIEDMSEELIEVHAKRNAMVGYKFSSGEEWEEEFIKKFPFEETVDQHRVWDEISVDMETPRPMDRLVVGDVGFGKTELAFRAAFRAISSGKQVAFLVPTTILAEQHFYSAIDRFNGFPVEIAMLSRFLNSKEQEKVVKELKIGKIDLLIGTHRIIQKDIEYKDLGLCIIDEEHRFGVKDKEKIKQYKKSIDCLALSATPIPRTLYQSIVQLRDMSLLNVAPKKRKPIRTFVEKFDENLVSKVIITELDRGGQVFYLHNRIASLEEVQNFIERLVPQATVATASGKMEAKQLEDTMYRFVNKGVNVLVSTTIIENGIDIPNVNTIIIDRADNYGIAQLYQLRGRVGRSDQTSFAYLLYPDELSISEVALKRLSIISDNSELGAGFQIAMRDLEVRGSGNLLGKEQSGSIFAIGYEHYIRLLDETMKKLKGISLSAPEPEFDLTYTGFIPDTFVNDTSTKMGIYKQIASVSTLDQYESLITNIEDTYGHIPEEVRNLFWISKLRILCTSLYISSLKEKSTSFELTFIKLVQVSHKNITTLIQSGKIRTSKHASNILIVPMEKKMYPTLEEKYKLLNECLMSIVAPSTANNTI